jgi:protein involved in polysaccharide export with SLBB domain/Tfp pilus assembly protein PilF
MKKLLLAGLLVCATFSAAASAAAPQQGADIYYRDGARFALEGRLDEAARAFEQAVALDPENGNAHYALGNVYAEMGRWADAVNAYYKALSLNREDVEALNNLGVALAARGQHAQAAGAFRRAIKIYPKWAEPHYHLAEAQSALGEEAEARESRERALRLRPDYAARPPRPFAAARATPAPSGGQILKAMNAVGVGAGGTDAPASAPASASTARVADGTAAVPAASAPDTSASAPDASDSRRNPPDTPTQPRAAAAPAGANVAAGAATAAPALSPYDLGLRESRAGRHREAVAALRQAVLLDRRDAAAQRALGDAYAALGEWRESVDAYEQAARLAPDDAETYQKLGRSYAKLRETAPEQPAGGAAASASQPTAAATRVETAADADPTAVYRIGPGDVLDVRALDGRAQSATGYKVTPTGLLDYPGLSQPLKVEGLTPEEAGARLFAALAARPAGPPPPRLAVGVREYASHAVIVGGMVKDPGTKILQREAVPLYVIVAHAQPLAGAGEVVVVARATGRTTAFDLADAAALKTLVRPGDVVTVRALPQRFVYVAGAVREPGQKQFHTGMTLTQALLAAGGVLARQGRGASVVAVIRQGDDGRLTTTRHDLAEIRAGRAPDPILRAGDRIEAPR